MASYHRFYEGADYGFEQEKSAGYGGQIPVSGISLATDPRSANQLKAVADKLNTGAKAVEVSMAMEPKIFEAVPKQHFQEINRLKKLAGAELTFHGPILEPTGISKNGWNEDQRKEAERQLWNVVDKAQGLEPDGNLVVTFHTSAGLPEMVERTPDGKIKEMWVFNEKTGSFTTVKPEENRLLGTTLSPFEKLEAMNKESWSGSLTQVSFHAHQGRQAIVTELGKSRAILPEGFKDFSIPELYKFANSNEGREKLKKLPKESQASINDVLNGYNYGDIYVRDSYNALQNLFDRAWENVKQPEDMAKLEKFKEDFKKKDILKKLEHDPNNIMVLADEIADGVRVLSSLSQAPQTLKPLNEFAIDKASDTFSEIAFKAFDKFKENAPIISLENPPAGGGLSRAEDMAKLIKEAREKVAEKLVEKKGMSEHEAKQQAEKLIGATWDVGHINMLKRYGFEKKHLIEETRKIKPFLKHIHLSDNFGFEHTELPMGMGDVPMKEYLEVLGDKAKKVKQVVEAGDWHQYFQTTPFRETLEAFGSPVYAMQMSPAWKPSGVTAGYFAGRGTNPEVHHSIYGAGFSGLPTELGGQIGRSRFSGAPIE